MTDAAVSPNSPRARPAVPADMTRHTEPDDAMPARCVKECRGQGFCGRVRVAPMRAPVLAKRTASLIHMTILPARGNAATIAARARLPSFSRNA